MDLIKRPLHSLYVAISSVVIKLIPDRVPVTFTGAGASRELCRAVADAGARRALVVTDAGLMEIGIAPRIVAALEKAGVACSVYAGVEPDPTFDQVEAGVGVYDAEGCDAVVAVGGGSSMDAAKVIAAAATNRVPVRKLEGQMKVRKPTAPLYAIPTTAGTGSEVTLAAVISEPDTHEKRFYIDPKLLPSMTALDPELMVGLPKPITAATGMDALTHAVESFLCLTSRPASEDYARRSVKLIFENLANAYEKGDDIAAREAMALASYYGGLAFTRTGVGYVHAIAHTFGAFYGTPHGLANAIALPHVLEFSLEPASARLAELADLIGAGGTSEVEKAGRFVVAVRELMGRIGISGKLEALREEDIPAIARQALAEAYLNYPVPRFMAQQDCEGLLQRMVA